MEAEHETLEHLKAHNAERLAKLAKAGVQVTNLGDAYLRHLVEHLLGDDLWVAQRKHELWVADQLDTIEANRNRMVLSAPGRVPPTNGRKS
jgi:hypothetical protein